jgi:neuroligin
MILYWCCRRFGEYVNNNEQRNWGYPDRGYGHQQPGGSNTDGYYYNTRVRGGVGVGGIGGRFHGNRPEDDPNYQSTPFPQPGILAGWRSDLQGRQRPDSINYANDRDVYVTTPVGQIQGFKVHLYDNPDPYSYFRPGQTPVERVQGNCSVFLGIPYAQPPIREGRFKVRMIFFLNNRYKVLLIISPLFSAQILHFL